MKNKMKYIMKYLYHTLLILLFFSLFFKCTASASNDVRLGTVGEWNDNCGEFHAVKLREIGGINYAFCATSKGMAIFTIHSDEVEVSLVEPFIPIGDCSDIQIETRKIGGLERNYAYITAEHEGGYRLYIRDITDPASSYYIGSCNIPDNKAYGVALSEGFFAYVAAGESGLRVIDISDPTKPAKVGALDTSGIAKGIAVSGSYAYVAGGAEGLQVIDISDPNRLKIVGHYPPYTTGYVDWINVIVSEGYAYCTTRVVKTIGSIVIEQGGGSLKVIDIRDPSEPVLVGSCDTPDPAIGVDVNESAEYAYCLTRRVIKDLKTYDYYLLGCDVRYGSLQVINISDPNKPVIMGSCDIPDYAKGVAVSVYGDYAYIAASESGLQVIDIRDPNGLKIVENCATTPNKAKVVTVSGNYAYVAYVVDGKGGLLAIDIDTNNPEAPKVVGSLDNLGIANGIAIYNKYFFNKNYACIAAGENGLQVVDITNPNVPEIVGSLDNLGIANGIAISGDYAYVAVFDKGLMVIDISNPTALWSVGRCDIPGYANGVAVSGDYAYVTCDSTLLSSCGEDYLRVIDISDPTKPAIVGTCSLPSDLSGIVVSSSYAYVANEERGLQVIDISDPAKPVIAGSCNTPGYTSGVALSGNNDYAYLADGEKGLQVIDISDLNGPEIVVSYVAADHIVGVAVSDNYAYLADYEKGLRVIDINNSNGLIPKGDYCDLYGHAIEIAESGGYAYVTAGEKGLQVINLGDPNRPEIDGNCDIRGYARGVTVSGDYAYVASETGLQVIDISVPNNPAIVKTCDTPGNARGVAISMSYAYVADGEKGLQVINVSDPNKAEIVGSFDANSPGGDPNIYAIEVAVSENYAYVAAGKSGLFILDISNPNQPSIVKIYDDPNYNYVSGVTISGDYAYVTDEKYDLRVIDIQNPNAPKFVGTYNTPGYAAGVAISSGYAYVADKRCGLLKLKIDIGPPPEGKGNLILVAGGNIDYRMLATQTTNTYTPKRAKALDHKDAEASYWQVTQILANHALYTFLKNSYEVYEIYYFNPETLQDIDNDGITNINQLIVDDFTPTSEKLYDIIKQFPPDHFANPGPLYICLIGHAAEDCFLIIGNEVITADELKDALSEFQEDTNRQVVVIIESAASGTFINDLAGPNITVITSTDDGTSYIKPDFSDTDNISYNSFTKAFMDSLGPHLNPNNIPDGPTETLNTRINALLKEAFIAARDQLREWAFEGLFFADQAPQMALPDVQFTSFNFSEDKVSPLTHLSINTFRDIPYNPTIIGYDPNNTPNTFSEAMVFFSSDTTILDPKAYKDIQSLCYYIPFGILKCTHTITPQKNGIVSLIAQPADPNNPHYLLSARITIEVSMNDPNYSKDLEKMAIIVAGYQGTGDYLWESTNTIANYAYRSLRSMGYTKQEIFYYNPYLLQDPIENRGCDDTEECNDIDGYPKKEIFNPNTDPNYSAFARINDSNIPIKELFLFLVDHGTKGTFRLNPSSYLDANNLINQLENIEENVSDKIIFLYDACYSGSFLDEIKNRINPNSPLSEKLITITSTDPNQLAYFLNQGIISFSYPFFDEWYLTHSLNKAFEYASATSLKGQTPEIYDPDIAWEWDLMHTYYTDEARPYIDNVLAYRDGGYLHLSADVFSLAGIDPNQVWAIIESAQDPLISSYGSAVTQAPEFNLSFEDQLNSPFGGRYKISVPDPCPSEAIYNINVYAKDKSGRTASYKTGIEDGQKQTIKALIIATDPNLIDPNEREKFTSQIKRAEAILESKELEKTNKDFEYGDLITIKGEDIDSLNDLPDISSLANDQILFIYLIGKAEDLGGNNTPCFYLNQNLAIEPNQFTAYMPQDTNQRVLILMDASRSSQFLSSCYPDNWHENWAGIASTDQDELFFYIGESGGELFPCFSNFFFSMVLSGATVAQAYRMAKNAVSLTQQHPDLFHRQKIESEYAINRYLNYYLGSSAIHGEDYPLISGCTAKVENGEISLSLMAHPDIDPNFINAWAILKSSPSSIGQNTMIVNLQRDLANNLHYIPDQDIPGDFPYCKALFIAEGRRVSDESSKTEWKEVPITKPESRIEEDGFEIDDDPNLIMFYAINEIFVNDLPSRHTFYCPDPNVIDPNNRPSNPKGCDDTDWVYFYAWKGISYEIYAQDLSKFGYFTKLVLYDPETSPIYPNGKSPLSGTNYMSFICKKSGYHMLKALPASSYPPEGIEYILAVCSPQAGENTKLLLEVINPKLEELSGLRSDFIITLDDKCILKSDTWSIYDPNNDIFRYYVSNIETNKTINIKVYQGNEAQEKLLCEEEVTPKSKPTHRHTFDLTDPSQCDCIDPNRIHITPDVWDDYDRHKESWFGFSNDPDYPWDPINNRLPGGDMDDGFPSDGNFDGDLISNYDEYSLNTNGSYPTVPVYLHKGINIYYFPSVYEELIVVKSQSCNYDSNTDECEPEKSNQDNPAEVDCYYYDKQGGWNYVSRVEQNKFNAIDIKDEGGALYLNLKSFEHPVLCLKSTFVPNSSKNLIKDLNENEIWSRYVSVEKGTDPDGKTLVLRWDSNLFYHPDTNGGHPSLYSEDDIEKRTLLVKDMLQTTEYEIEPEGYLSAWCMSQLTYVIEWNKEVSIPMNLPEGWSMISLPVTSNGRLVSDLFPDAEVIYGYEKESGYVRIKRRDEIEDRKGYWILFKDAQDLVISGDPFYEYSFPISEPGWDMIGGCSFSARTSADSCTIEVIYGYVPGLGYQRTDVIEPGKGYWMLYNKGIDQCMISVRAENNQVDL